MAPQRKVYETQAERVAAYRSRAKEHGLVRMEVRVSEETAQGLRQEAKSRGCTVGEALEALLTEKGSRK